MHERAPYPAEPVGDYEPLSNARALTLAHAFLKSSGYGPAPDVKALTLRHWREEWFEYAGGAYRKCVWENLFADLVEFLNAQRVRVKSTDGEWRVDRLHVTKKLVNETLMQMQVCCQARVDQMPDWLDRHRPPRENVIAFRNGWIDIAEFLEGRQPVQNPPSEWWFSENMIPHDFRTDATCPRWLAFVHDALSGDAESIQLLQEWFGYNLTSDTSQQKMLWLHGQPGAGKGTVLRTLMRVVGENNCASPKMSTLGKEFGLEGLVNKAAAILADAHLGRQDDSVAVLDTLLAITGNDAVDVPRKWLKPLNSVRLGVRFTLGINALPTLPDASNAMRRRTLILPFRNSYEGRENTRLDAELAPETPGILLWALDGLRSLRLRGRFAQPPSGEALIDRMCRLASPIKSFVEEMCVVDPNVYVIVGDLYAAYEKWMRKNGHSPKSIARFGEDLTQAVPSAEKKRLREGDKRSNAYLGIGLETEVPY